MIRGLVFLAVVGAALCVPINTFEEIPAQYKELIPDEVAKVLKELTDADKTALREVALNYTLFNDENEALTALKAKSESTYAKVKQLHYYVQAKIEALHEDAKAFATAVVAEVRKIHASVITGTKPSLEELKTSALNFVNKYKALSEEAKESFRTQFPIMTSIVQNEKFQVIADNLLKQN